jgi:transcriptional regulator with XRE-family HTH domain
MTQEELAGLVSLTRTSITNVEKGRQKLLLHTLSDIAEALEVDLASLLPGDGKEADTHLRDSLKRHSPSAKAFIESALSAAQRERSGDGS